MIINNLRLLLFVIIYNNKFKYKNYYNIKLIFFLKKYLFIGDWYFCIFINISKIYLKKFTINKHCN